MMPTYDRDVYSRDFARLLNKALKSANGDARKALVLLESRYRLVPSLIFSRHRAETSDAYLDVREHLLNRIHEIERDQEGS
jgi:hypothetical protein